MTLQSVIGLIEQALGKRARIDRQPPSAADMKETWADITMAGGLLGWTPQVTPADGFRRTVDWYRANRSWLHDIRV